MKSLKTSNLTISSVTSDGGRTFTVLNKEMTSSNICNQEECMKKSKNTKLVLTPEELDTVERLMVAYFFHVKPTSINYNSVWMDRVKALYEKLRTHMEQNK